MKRALVALCGCVLASASHAAIIAGWETGLDGWYVNGGGYAVARDTATGVTEGAYSMVVTLPNGYNNNLRSGMTNAQYDALKLNTDAKVDITLPANPNGNQLQVQLQIQGAYAVPGGAASTGFNKIFPIIAITAPGTHTLSWNYDSQFDLPDNSTRNWGEFRFIVNATGGFVPGNTYFDNFQAIPEPASMALLAPTAMLLRRRRAV